MAKLETLARNLRSQSTDAEQLIWRHLKNRQIAGFKFRRQHPLPPFIVDFVCLEAGLVVELDGGQHVERSAQDAARTSKLNEMGFRVIRFWDDEALKQTEAVLEEVLRQLTASRPLTPALSPEGRG